MAREHLESVGEAFLAGYNLALEGEEQLQLAERLNVLGAEFRGFAFEGAAMAMTILDSLTPKAARQIGHAALQRVLAHHTYAHRARQLDLLLASANQALEAVP